MIAKISFIFIKKKQPAAFCLHENTHIPTRWKKPATLANSSYIMVLMWCLLARRTSKLTQTHRNGQNPSAFLYSLYLELGLALLGEVWEWGLPASGSLVLSPSAEEEEISPAHKHAGITHNQGLMNACVFCVMHFYCIYSWSIWPAPSTFVLLTCTEMTSVERWGYLEPSQHGNQWEED